MLQVLVMSEENDAGNAWKECNIGLKMMLHLRMMLKVTMSMIYQLRKLQDKYVWKMCWNWKYWIKLLYSICTKRICNAAIKFCNVGKDDGIHFDFQFQCKKTIKLRRNLMICKIDYYDNDNTNNDTELSTDVYKKWKKDEKMMRKANSDQRADKQRWEARKSLTCPTRDTIFI